MPWTKSGFQRIETKVRPGFEWTGLLESEKLSFDVDVGSVNCIEGLKNKIDSNGRWIGPPGGEDGDPGECVVPSYDFGEFECLTASEAASVYLFKRDGSSVFVTDYGALVHFSDGKFAAPGVVIEAKVETLGSRFRVSTNAGAGAVVRYGIYATDPGGIRLEDLGGLALPSEWVDAGPSKHVRVAVVDPIGLHSDIAGTRT